MALSCQNHKVLVLGAGGKVGRLLSQFWRRNPPEGLCPLYQSGGVKRDGYLTWRADGDVSALPEAETIVALWGRSEGDRQSMQVNVELGLRALEIATELGAKRLLLASSSAVYAGSGAGRHAEADMLVEPSGAYGASKLEMERAVLAASGAGRGPVVSVLRLANIIGADSLFDNLQPGGEVVLDRFSSGGGPMRSYLTVGDLAHVLGVLATCPQAVLPSIVNVAGSHALAMADLVEQAAGQVVWQAAPPTALERVEMNTSLLQQITGPLAQSSDPGLAIASWQRGRQG